jgi:hypothetical protein
MNFLLLSPSPFTSSSHIPHRFLKHYNPMTQATQSRIRMYLLRSQLFILLSTVWQPSGECTQQVSARDMCNHFIWKNEVKDPQNSNTGLFCTVPPSRNISDSILSCNCTLLITFNTWKHKRIYPQNSHCLKWHTVKSQIKVSLGSSGWWWWWW